MCNDELEEVVIHNVCGAGNTRFISAECRACDRVRNMLGSNGSSRICMHSIGLCVKPKDVE